MEPQQPQVVYVGEPSLSAVKVRAEKEAELRTVESYWQQRLQAIREHHLKSGQIEEASFKATVDNVDKMFLKSRANPICSECRHEVLECYKKHKSESLRCADQVRQFRACVESARIGSLGRKG